MADRATMALRLAATSPSTSIMRVALGSEYAVEGDAGVFATWLDEIIGPSGARLLDPIAAEAPALGAHLMALEQRYDLQGVKAVVGEIEAK